MTGNVVEGTGPTTDSPITCIRKEGVGNGVGILTEGTGPTSSAEKEMTGPATSVRKEGARNEAEGTGPTTGAEKEGTRSVRSAEQGVERRDNQNLKEGERGKLYKPRWISYGNYNRWHP